MGGENRTSPAALEFFRALEQEPYKYGFFHTVRRINCLFPDKPLTGHSARPSEDPVRFTQEPYTSFAPSTLSHFEIDGKSAYPTLSQKFMGLFGPNGPLPLHLTEFARDRVRHHRDRSMASFLDIFHHRAVSLFYATWAQAQPTVQFDRPDQDRFSTYLGSLVGLGLPSLRDGDDMHHLSKLGFAGHLGSLPRHVSGLTALIQEYFDVPVKIYEFVAHWMKIRKQDQLQLGIEGSMGSLGENAVIGERVWQRQDKFRVSLGPLDLEQYSSFLPTGKSFSALVSAVRNYVGLEYLWEINLVLKKEQKPVTCLGKSGELGWTSWLKTEDQQVHVDDLKLQVENYA
jgi:type VI secretion system protein ImpH